MKERKERGEKERKFKKCFVSYHSRAVSVELKDDDTFFSCFFLHLTWRNALNNC
jgi:hypothetical protein